MCTIISIIFYKSFWLHQHLAVYPLPQAGRLAYMITRGKPSEEHQTSDRSHKHERDPPATNTVLYFGHHGQGELYTRTTVDTEAVGNATVVQGSEYAGDAAEKGNLETTTADFLYSAAPSPCQCSSNLAPSTSGYNLLAHLVYKNWHVPCRRDTSYVAFARVAFDSFYESLVLPKKDTPRSNTSLVHRLFPSLLHDLPHFVVQQHASSHPAIPFNRKHKSKA
jgi:hypothetical protein